MKLGVLVAGSSGSLRISSGLCSSISFGVVSILLLRFSFLFKCIIIQWIRNFIPYLALVS